MFGIIKDVEYFLNFGVVYWKVSYVIGFFGLFFKIVLSDVLICERFVRGILDFRLFEEFYWMD